MQPTTNNK